MIGKGPRQYAEDVRMCSQVGARLERAVYKLCTFHPNILTYDVAVTSVIPKHIRTHLIQIQTVAQKTNPTHIETGSIKIFMSSLLYPSHECGWYFQGG